MKLNRAASLFVSIALLASVVVGYSTTASAAGNPNCNAVDGDYIVSFAPGVSVDKEIKSAPGRAINAKFKYDKVINGFAAALSAEQVCAFQKRPNIQKIELDGVVSIDQVTPSWGLDRIDQNGAVTRDSNGNYVTGEYSYDTTGLGVDVYVIDTGVTAPNATEFGSRLKQLENFTGDRKNYDCNGHGTHVAGTIGGTVYGVAKGVSIYPIKVLDCRGSGTNSGVIKGVERVIALHTNGKAVANMSLGGGVSDLLDLAVLALIDDGVTVVVAAGNSKVDVSTTSPARVTRAITVAASDLTDTFASFSNFGTGVDVIAPGVGITSDYIISKTNLNGVKTLSGTSMASPHVAGVLARYLESVLVNPKPGLTSVPGALLILDKIQETSTIKLKGTPNNLIYIAPPIN